MSVGPGERAAGFSEVWREHAADVHRFARYLSGRPALAEDLAAEAFLRLWTTWERVDGLSVKGYLLAIVRNLYLRQVVRDRRLGPIPETAAGEPREAAATTIDEMVARDDLDRVLAEIGRLPEADRSALLLRAHHGLSYEQIGRILGIPAATAKVKVHRARLRLARIRRGDHR